MARCEECKANKVCDHNIYILENCFNFIPNDVVPKSEVEKLQHKYDLAVAEREANVKGFTEELEKAKKNAEKWRYNLEAVLSERAEDKAEVAREIFEEIESIVDKRTSFNGNIYSLLVKRDFAELKKKYTE